MDHVRRPTRNGGTCAPHLASISDRLIVPLALFWLPPFLVGSTRRPVQLLLPGPGRSVRELHDRRHGPARRGGQRRRGDVEGGHVRLRRGGDLGSRGRPDHR